MMKRKTFFILALISVSILLTGCTPKNKEDGNSTTNETNQEESLKGSLFDLVKLGKNVKCTFSIKDEGGESSGTTYVSGGKARSDFTAATTTGEKYESHSITDNDWIYTWTSVSEQGMKMKLSELPKSEDTDKISAAKSFESINENMDYKCSPWLPDGNKFNAPTNIEFIDYTEMMKNLQAETDKLKEGLKGMCGTCDLAGDAEKIAKCKESLGCD